MNKQYYVYILGNSKPTLYIGITSNLIRRVFEHKNSKVEGFTKRYNVTRLLYYEVFEAVDSAILREKQIKRWHREWKLNLIKKNNPQLKDLYQDII